MREAARFVGDAPMVAHNAAFDSKFWSAELARTGIAAAQPFACTVLLSRRLYPEAPSHKLGFIVDHLGLPRAGRAHRALADAEMAAALLARMQHDLRLRWNVADPGHACSARCNAAHAPRSPPCSPATQPRAREAAASRCVFAATTVSSL